MRPKDKVGLVAGAAASPDSDCAVADMLNADGGNWMS